ncbi:MAG: sugar ABC transporter permease [Desulfobacterota bacterium]|nr:sugar ABC transporter permease [Thermodesulfobacteriota bacterium]
MRRIERWTSYSYLFPGLFFMGVFTFIPVFMAAYLSLFKWNVSHPEPTFTGLSNYVEVFKAPLFWLVLKNNLLYAFTTIPISMGLALFLAILINQRMGWIRSLYRGCLFYPTMIPMVAAAMLWVWIFNPGLGIFNYYLGFLGVPKIEWLYDMRFALLAIIIMSIWKNFGYYMLIFLAGLQSIPKHYYEAAAIDGATGWKQFRYVTFPMLAPATLFVFVVAIISSFQVFDQVFVMTQGGPGDRTNVLVFYIYQHAFRFWDLGMGSTLTTLFMLGLLVAIWLVFRVIGRRVYYEV